MEEGEKSHFSRFIFPFPRLSSTISFRPLVNRFWRENLRAEDERRFGRIKLDNLGHAKLEK